MYDVVYSLSHQDGEREGRGLGAPLLEIRAGVGAKSIRLRAGGVGPGAEVVPEGAALFALVPAGELGPRDRRVAVSR
jgi:hypothetical protein